MRTGHSSPGPFVQIPCLYKCQLNLHLMGQSSHHSFGVGYWLDQVEVQTANTDTCSVTTTNCIAFIAITISIPFGAITTNTVVGTACTDGSGANWVIMGYLQDIVCVCTTDQWLASLWPTTLHMDLNCSVRLPTKDSHAINLTGAHAALQEPAFAWTYRGSPSMSAKIFSMATPVASPPSTFAYCRCDVLECASIVFRHSFRSHTHFLNVDFKLRSYGSPPPQHSRSTSGIVWQLCMFCMFFVVVFVFTGSWLTILWSGLMSTN